MVHSQYAVDIKSTTCTLAPLAEELCSVSPGNFMVHLAFRLLLVSPVRIAVYSELIQLPNKCGKKASARVTFMHQHQGIKQT
jgi:hypothetical protein